MRSPRSASLALAAAVALLVLPGAPASSKSPATASRATAASDEAAVRAAIDAFFAAAQKRDWDAATALLSEDFEIYTDEAAGFNKADYSRLLREDDLEVRQMELRDTQVRVSADGTMAWAKYRGTFRGTSRGATHDVETAETLIFAKEAGQWKQVRAHASVKPTTTAASAAH